MKNRSMVAKQIFTGVIGILLLLTYLYGSIVMGKVNGKSEYVNLISQSEETGMTYELAKNIHMQNEKSDEPLLFTNWRQDRGGQVSYSKLNRVETAEVMCVYGRTDLLFPSYNILDIDSKTGCLISKELAFCLFGGTEVTGNTVEYKEQQYEIIDVIDSNIPLFVYELEQDDANIVLDRAVVRCKYDSPEQTKAEYNKIAGTWDLVDYSVLWRIILLGYLVTPWILGSGVLLSTRQYKKEAQEILAEKIKKRKRYTGIRQFLRYNKEYIIWTIVWIVFLIVLIICTVIQIKIPVDLVPDQWSNFEFWLQHFKEKKEGLLLIITIRKGVVDLSYIAMLYKGAMASVISIIEASIFIKQMRKYVL